MTYIYRLKSTGTNSHERYGNCEVCHRPASEVFIQAEMREYEHGTTYADCHPHTFGHEECLKGLQR